MFDVISGHAINNSRTANGDLVDWKTLVLNEALELRKEQERRNFEARRERQQRDFEAQWEQLLEKSSSQPCQNSLGSTDIPLGAIPPEVGICNDGNSTLYSPSTLEGKETYHRPLVPVSAGLYSVESVIQLLPYMQHPRQEMDNALAVGRHKRVAKAWKVVYEGLKSNLGVFTQRLRDRGLDKFHFPIYNNALIIRVKCKSFILS